MQYPATSATTDTLPNGLTVILDPDPTAPVVSAQIWVETGSMHEDTFLGAGLSHFLEHMVFKGTRDYDADTLATVVQAAGGHWNAYTTFDRTVYYIDGPSKSLPEFLKCLTGLVYFPTIPESEFEKEKDVIRREIDMGLDDPDNVATRDLLSTAFQADPRRHPVIGHRHLFDAITYPDMIRYHKVRYTTDRSFIVISGDFDPDTVLQQITELTADCQPGCGKEPNVVADPPQLGPRFMRSTFAIPASRISLAWKIPAVDHPDSPAYEVLAAILGRGRSSLLYHHLRDQQGLALEISAFAWTFAGCEGIFGISADADHQHRETLVAAIHDQILSIQTLELDAWIDKAKRQIAASQFRSLTTASGRATDLASNWHEARDLNFTRSHVDLIQQVTADDIRRVAAKLNPNRVTQTILDPIDAPPPNKAQKILRDKEAIEVTTLDNGLPIALIPDRRVPLIHFQAAARAGLLSETPENNGINQLLSSTLTKGTTTRNSQDIALALESLGASITAATGNNALLIQAGGLAPDFAQIADVFCDVISSPSFPEEAMLRERASQQASLEEALQDPLHLAFKTMRATAFDGKGYGLDSLGTAETLKTLTRQSLVDHHRKHFNPSNMALAVAGDFDPAELKDKLNQQLANLKPGESWTPNIEPPLTGKSVTRHLNKKQAVLALGYPGASAIDDTRHALAFLHSYCSDMAGPLFLRIREELGLAYQVGATQFVGHGTGLFSFYCATSPEQAELAHEELLKEIGKIAAHGIPADAFERVRETVLSSVAIQQQSIASSARHATLNQLFGLPADEHLRLIETYEAVSAKDVADAAKQAFTCEPVTAIVSPK